MKKAIIYIFVIVLITNVSNAQCYYKDATSFWSSSKTTGNLKLDNMINTENAMLNAIFGVHIDLYVGGDVENNGNALFHPSCKLQGCIGQIWLGKNLMNELFQQAHGPDRLKAVFAHEYGHALQHQHGWAGSGKHKELHADFLSGYYIGVKGSISEDKLTSFIDQFYSIGDNNFFSASHHGTGLERACAFREGYKFATDLGYTVYQAYVVGKDYVLANTPCTSYKPTKTYKKVGTPAKVEVQKGSLVLKSEKKHSLFMIPTVKI